MRLYNDDEIMAMLREVINMKAMEYLFFCAKLKRYCPQEHIAKIDLVIKITLIIRTKIREENE